TVYLTRQDPSRAPFFFSSRRRHTRSLRDWSSDVCSSDLTVARETTEPEKDALARQLSRMLGKRVVPHITQNPAILGGLIVRVGRSEERRVGKECSCGGSVDE